MVKFHHFGMVKFYHKEKIAFSEKCGRMGVLPLCCDMQRQWHPSEQNSCSAQKNGNNLKFKLSQFVIIQKEVCRFKA
jgi:hypothetical protein